MLGARKVLWCCLLCAVLEYVVGAGLAWSVFVCQAAWRRHVWGSAVLAGVLQHGVLKCLLRFF